MTQQIKQGQIYTDGKRRVIITKTDKTPQAVWVKLNNGKIYGKEAFLRAYKLVKE